MNFREILERQSLGQETIEYALWVVPSVSRSEFPTFLFTLTAKCGIFVYNHQITGDFTRQVHNNYCSSVSMAEVVGHSPMIHGTVKHQQGYFPHYRFMGNRKHTTFAAD